MVKKHLLELLDPTLIVFLAVIAALCVILTIVFSDKVQEFSTKYKKSFYAYILSFVLIYALLAFLAHNKLFEEVTHEFLFYQVVSFLLGILHCRLYHNSFAEFNTKNIFIELLFAFLVILYSSILFTIIYTALNGIYFTYLMCIHFVLFLCPTGINISFNYMMLIPPKQYATWQIPDKEFPYPEIEPEEMQNLALITLLIHKQEDSKNYSSIRTKGPLRMDFGNLFYQTLTNYNARNTQNPIALKHNGENCHWVFFKQPKWYESARYVDAKYTLGMNGITENTVIICVRHKREISQAEKMDIIEEEDFLYTPKAKE